MAKKKLLYLLIQISIVLFFTKNIAISQVHHKKHVLDSNLTKMEEIKKKSVPLLSTTNFLTKKTIQESSRKQVLCNRYDNLYNFSKTNISKSEQLTKATLQKVNKRIEGYKKIANEVENKIHKINNRLSIKTNPFYPLEGKITNNPNHKRNTENRVTSNRQFYIALSFSMPTLLFNSFIDQSKMIGAYAIIRGLKNNSFQDTLKELKHLSKSGAFIQINPKIFKIYGIQVAPTFISIDNEFSDVMSGNVSIYYVLSQFSNIGDTRSSAAIWLSKYKK